MAGARPAARPSVTTTPPSVASRRGCAGGAGGGAERHGRPRRRAAAVAAAADAVDDVEAPRLGLRHRARRAAARSGVSNHETGSACTGNGRLLVGRDRHQHLGRQRLGHRDQGALVFAGLGRRRGGSSASPSSVARLVAGSGSGGLPHRRRFPPASCAAGRARRSAPSPCTRTRRRARCRPACVSSMLADGMVNVIATVSPVRRAVMSIARPGHAGERRERRALLPAARERPARRRPGTSRQDGARERLTGCTGSGPRSSRCRRACDRRRLRQS